MADKKLTDALIGAITTPTDDDLMYIVDAPGTVPASKKITWANIKATLGSVFMAIVAPGNAGNVLTSSGTAWQSGAPALGAYTLISDVVVGAGGAITVEFANIPQTYKHLKILFTARNEDNNAYIKFNNESGNYYIAHTNYFYGTTGQNGTDQYTKGAPPLFAYPAIASTPDAIFACFELTIYNYINTNTAKSYMCFGGQVYAEAASNLFIYNSIGAFTKTDAISNIKIFNDGTKVFAQYSRFTLYGLS